MSGASMARMVEVAGLTAAAVTGPVVVVLGEDAVEDGAEVSDVEPPAPPVAVDADPAEVVGAADADSGGLEADGLEPAPLVAVPDGADAVEGDDALAGALDSLAALDPLAELEAIEVPETLEVLGEPEETLPVGLEVPAEVETVEMAADVAVERLGVTAVVPELTVVAEVVSDGAGEAEGLELDCD